MFYVILWSVYNVKIFFRSNIFMWHPDCISERLVIIGGEDMAEQILIQFRADKTLNQFFTTIRTRINKFPDVNADVVCK